MQHNVTWQTTLEHHRLVVPSGRTLTTSHSCRRLKFWKYVGPPFYTPVLSNFIISPD